MIRVFSPPTNINRQKIDHKGEYHEYTDDELLQLDKKKFSEQEMAEYDRDWSSGGQNVGSRRLLVLFLKRDQQSKRQLQAS